MNYELQRIWDKRHAELKLLDIDIKPNQSLIVTPTRVIQLTSFTSSSTVERIIRKAVEESRTKKAEAQSRRQSTLFQEN